MQMACLSWQKQSVDLPVPSAGGLWGVVADLSLLNFNKKRLSNIESLFLSIIL